MARIEGGRNVASVSPRIAADPGVNVPSGTFGDGGAGKIRGDALAAVGKNVTVFSGKLREAGEKVRSREDAVERARAVNQFNSESADELRTLQTESDLSSSDVMLGYTNSLRERRDKIIAEHKGSPESALSLAERLERSVGSFSGTASTLNIMGQRELVTDSLGENLETLTAQALNSPDDIDGLFDSLDEEIDDLAPALTPDQEADFRSVGRQQITVSAIDGLLNRGAAREARAVFEETPGLLAVLSPEQQRNIERRITAFEQAEVEARSTGQRKIAELEAVLGRKATPTERIRAAGVEAPAGAQTPSQKIQGIEAALGRPVTTEERERAVLGDAPGAATEAGKVIEDRARFVTEFGATSPEVAAFDDAQQGGPPSLTDVAGIRREFTQASRPFVTVRDAFNSITSAGQDGTGASDMSLIFSYMRLLDPGSRVTEGEIALTGQTTGVPGRIVNLYNAAVDGEILNDEQRQDFLERSQDLFGARLSTQILLEQQFTGIAERAGVDTTQDVVIDFIGPFRNAGTGGGGQVAPRQPPRVQFDLQGNPIGGR